MQIKKEREIGTEKKKGAEQISGERDSHREVEGCTAQLRAAWKRERVAKGIRQIERRVPRILWQPSHSCQGQPELPRIVFNSVSQSSYP